MKTFLSITLTLMTMGYSANAQMPQVFPKGISVAVSLPDVEPAGIAVTETGRIFLALPRGGVNHKHPSVVELVDGKPVAFPNEVVNRNSDTDFSSHLVSVLGITLYKNTLWILDQGKRAGIDGIPDGSTKIVAVDINTKEIVRNISVPKPFFRETIQLNDLRFDPTHGTEGTIYISNNGFARPDHSIIVADVATGKLRELFRDAPEVSPQKGFMSFVEGKPHVLNYEKPAMPQGGVNGIELSPDFKTLYWTVPTNPNYYSIPTDVISDFRKSEAAIKRFIHWEGQTVSNGGITIDPEGTLYFGDASRYSIIQRDTRGNVSLTAYDPRLIWPDGMAFSNGYLYVTIGQWHRAPGLNNGKDLRRGPYEVLKIPVKKKIMNYQKTEVRAIDHIGITVSDIEAAAKFLEDAFGASAIYDNIVPSDPPATGPEAEAKLGFAKGTAIVHMRMMRIGDGACLELFEMTVPGERKKDVIPSDIGLQHFAVYTDDIETTKKKFEKAGGRLLQGPNEMLGREGGKGNRFMYAVTPWGTFVELITYPSELAIEKETTLRRWKPQLGKEE